MQNHFYSYPDDSNLTNDEKISERKSYLIDRQIKFLSGKPSSLADSLSNYWDGRKPEIPQSAEDPAESRYSLMAFHRQKVHDCITKISQKYSISFHAPDNSEQDRKTFIVSVSCIGKDGREENFISSCMDTEKFKAVFRDLYSLKLSPVMHYKFENDKMKHISNVSLGNIRMYDFKHMGITDNANDELVLAGLDNESNRDFLELRSEKPFSDDAIYKENFLSRINLHEENDKKSLNVGLLAEPSTISKLGKFFDGDPKWLARELVEGLASRGFSIEDVQKHMAELQKSVKDIMFKNPEMHKRFKENENKSKGRESSYTQ